MGNSATINQVKLTNYNSPTFKAYNRTIKRERIASYYSDPTFKDYMREINKIPLLPEAEQKALLIRVYEGDTSVVQKLTLGNLRLVVGIATSYGARATHFKIMDLIQEGNAALMKAIETFNPEFGIEFSTYATTVIKHGIERALANHEDEVRISIHMMNNAYAYDKLIEACEQEGKPIPSDEDAAEILGITINALVDAKASKSLKTVSMSSTVNNDDGKTELGDILSSYESGYDDLTSKTDDFDWLVALKDILTPEQYFIAYYHILNPHPLTQTEIAKYFHITPQRVQQKIIDITEKIKGNVKGRNIDLSSTIDKICKREGKLYENLNIEPYSPDKIVTYLYVKDYLTDLEKCILISIFFPKYNLPISVIASSFNLSIDEYKLVTDSIKGKIISLIEDKDKYKRFKKNLLITYGLNIYNLKASPKVVDYEEIHNNYSSLSYDEIIDLLGDINKLPTSTQKLIQKYFGVPKASTNSFEKINGEVNAVIHGYQEKNTTIATKYLSKAYYKHKSAFSDIEALYIECFIIGAKDPSEFTKIYGPHKNLRVHRHRFELISKLEKMYYNIDGIFEGMLTKEAYKNILREHRSKIPNDIVALLNAYYGNRTAKKEVSELATEYGVTSEKMSSDIFEAKDKVLVIATNRSQKIIADKKTYASYITNPIYEYSDDTRTALRLFIIQGKDYEHIASVLDTTTKEVATLVSKGIQKMDFYRFGVIDPIKVLPENVKKYFLDPDNKFNDTVKKIITLKYMNYMANEEIAKRVKRKLSEVNRTVSDFNASYLKWLIKDTSLSTQDIRAEIFAHPVESVLTLVEKKIISLYLGIICEYNPTGKKHTPKEIEQALEIKGKVSNKIGAIINKLKSKKIEYTKPDMIFKLSRDKVLKTIEDPHVPISSSDKELVSYIMGLNDYPLMTLKEFAEKTGENEKTLRRRYQMAMVNMNKYLLKELPGIISYEYDIEPRLKFFSKSDRIIIYDVFKSGMSIEQIAKKYELSSDIAKSIVARIHNYLYLLLNETDVPVLNFDYIESVKDEPDLPFNGSGVEIYKVFELYFGQTSFTRLNMKEIVATLNLNISEDTLKRMLHDFILACEKYRDKIRKAKSFTYDEVKSYYCNNLENLTPKQKSQFSSYLSKYDENGGINVKLSQSLRNLLLANTLEKPFNLARASKEEVHAILKKYYHNLSKRTKSTIMAKVGIFEREYMSGREINQLYRALDDAVKRNQTQGEARTRTR